VKGNHGHRHGHISNSPGEENLDGAPAQQEGIQVKGLIEGGLLYIGIPAATLYPLSFIALGVQLWRDAAFPYRDFTMVWEAVALIPQTVVVATGIRLIYLSVIATILGAAVAGMLLALSRRRKSGEGGEGRPPWGTPQNGRLWTIMLILLLPLAAAGLLVRGTHPWTADPTTIFCTWPGSSRYAREVSGYRHTGRVAREVPFRVGPTGGNRDATSAPRRSAGCREARADSPEIPHRDAAAPRPVRERTAPRVRSTRSSVRRLLGVHPGRTGRGFKAQMRSGRIRFCSRLTNPRGAICP
jgi:hypothetical protein